MSQVKKGKKVFDIRALAKELGGAKLLFLGTARCVTVAFWVSVLLDD